MEDLQAPVLHTYSLNIYYGTQTGTAKLFAEQLANAARIRGIAVAVGNLKDLDPEDTLTQEVETGNGCGTTCTCS